ncbi:acyl-CoA dehydrogenase family protein [uncultured Mycobacterium sp.]|uniref:acyl-CoA dehydrogenase family protein n=1 Tax=uncultured Mycobacterium sp. TaxID=171292 RepID=UPI0035CAE947
MDLAISAEQRELARTVGAFLEKRSPEAQVRRLMEDGAAADPDVWAQMAQQLGLQGLIIPETYGGGGSGFADVALVLEQMGAALLVAPFLSAVVSSSALMLSDRKELRAEYLPGVAGGEWFGTLALADETGRWDAESCCAYADIDYCGYRVSGVKSYVLDGQYADFYIVSAGTDDGVRLFVIDFDAPGIGVTPLQPLDPTRPIARLTFDRVPARLLSADPGLVDRVLAIAAIALAAEQVGGAQRCLDMALDYAKTRIQFGRPIGGFQAIKHKCADMLVAVESARSAAYHAARVLDDAADDPRVAAAVAQVHCSQVYSMVAGENIQIHGGIGFTWEHPAHLYLRRAKSSEKLFGDPAAHRERLATLVGI